MDVVDQVEKPVLEAAVVNLESTEANLEADMTKLDASEATVEAVQPRITVKNLTAEVGIDDKDEHETGQVFSGNFLFGGIL